VLADHDAEKALVAAAIWERDLSPRESGLKPEDFDHPGWREVWASAIALEAAGRAPDALSVLEHMKARGVDLSCVGGPSGLIQADLGMAALVAWDKPARIARVREMAERRGLKALAASLAAAAHDPNLTPQKAALDTSGRLARFAASGNRPVATFRDAINEMLDQMHAIRAGTYQEYLPTGIDVWDEFLAGLQRAKLGLLGAYPSVGKGAVMLRAILNAAQMPTIQRKDGTVFRRKPGIFSLEDLKIWMSKRYTAAKSGVPVRRLMQNERLPEHYERNVEDAVMACHDWADNILIEDSSGLSADQIACTARQWVVQQGCTEVWIDNGSEVDVSGAPGERTDLKTAYMVRLFRDVAKDLNIPVWLLVHFKQPQNSTSEEPRFLVPTSSMWKNSGAFAEAARNSVALYLDKDAPRDWILGRVTKQTEGEKDTTFAMPFNASAGLVESTGGRRRGGETGFTQGRYQEEA
jgi:replicative DNA helicase